MWHEARKHEKKIRGIMIDHRRRAEKSREFYENIRRDPASYLQIHGQRMKIHIDVAISQAAELSLVPWMGDSNNMIDRFDVRTNLDYIPTSADVSVGSSENDPLTADQECQLNYERYRNLVQNDYLENSEQKILQMIHLKERCGEQNQNIKTKQELRKKLAEKKAAIGYTYDDDHNSSKTRASKNVENSSSDSDQNSEEEVEDLDTMLRVDQLEDKDDEQRLNLVAKRFGIKTNSFIKFLQADEAEADRLRIAKEIENEKSMFVGRKSRRERKELIQERLLIMRSINTEECEIDHFSNKTPENKTKKKKKSRVNGSSDDSSDEEDDDDDDDDDEDSKSEDATELGKIEFITSFGGEDDDDQEEILGRQSKKNSKAKAKKLDKTKSRDDNNNHNNTINNHGNKKKISVKEKLKLISDKSEEPLMYGPALPSQHETDSKMAKSFKGDLARTLGNEDSFRFNANFSHQKSNRSYRFAKGASDDDDRSPRPRRSPSIRQNHRRHSRSSSISSSLSDYSRRRLSSSHRHSRREDHRRYPRSPLHHHSRRQSSSRESSPRRSFSHRNRFSRRSVESYKSSSFSRSRSRDKDRDFHDRDRRLRRHHRSRSRIRSRRSSSREINHRSRYRRSRSKHRSQSRSRDRSRQYQSSISSKSRKKSKKDDEMKKSEKDSKQETFIQSTSKENKSRKTSEQSSAKNNRDEIGSDSNVENKTIAECLLVVTAEEKNTEPKPEMAETELKPPLKRYYRHDLAEDNSEGDEDDGVKLKASSGLLGQEDTNSTNKVTRNSSLNILSSLNDRTIKSSTTNQQQQSGVHQSTITVGSSKMANLAKTPQERMKRLLQAQLDKQFKLDKKAEIDKLERQKIQQIKREEEFNKLTKKIREKRKRGRRSSSESSACERRLSVSSYSSSPSSGSSSSSSLSSRSSRRYSHRESQRRYSPHKSKSRSKPRTESRNDRKFRRSHSRSRSSSPKRSLNRSMAHRRGRRSSSDSN